MEVIAALHKRWDDISHDEQVEIVNDWLYTQHDHRSLVSEWLSQTKSSNGFVTDFLLYMARMMVVRGKASAINLAAKLVEENEENEFASVLIDRQGQLLTGVVNAIKGEPPSDTMWSHHDAPELAAGVVTKLDAALAWIESAPHGDDCFVSHQYDGDPGDRCNCGKDSIAEYLAESQPQPTNAEPMKFDCGAVQCMGQHAREEDFCRSDPDESPAPLAGGIRDKKCGKCHTDPCVCTAYQDAPYHTADAGKAVSDERLTQLIAQLENGHDCDEIGILNALYELKELREPFDDTKYPGEWPRRMFQTHAMAVDADQYNHVLAAFNNLRERCERQHIALTGVVDAKDLATARAVALISLPSSPHCKHGVILYGNRCLNCERESP